MRYDREVRKLLREMEENMVFLSRFLEWDIHMVVEYKKFLDLFYFT